MEKEEAVAVARVSVVLAAVAAVVSVLVLLFFEQLPLSVVEMWIMILSLVLAFLAFMGGCFAHAHKKRGGD